MKKLQSSSRKTRCFVSKCGRHLGNKIVKIQVNLDKKIHKLDNNIPINIWERFFRRKVVFFGVFFAFFSEVFAEPPQLSGAQKLDKFSRPNLLKASVQNRIISEILVLRFGVIRKFALFTFWWFYCKIFYILQNLFVAGGGF